MKTITKRLAIVLTTKCTLRCRLCSNHIPRFEKPAHTPYSEIVSDLDHIFELFDYIDWLQLVGGEVFMRRDIGEIIEYAFKYKAKFKKMVIMTNATVLPRGTGMAVLKQHGKDCLIQISDYGPLSSKKDYLLKSLEQNEISCVVKQYYGDNQYYGGWIDNTNREPFSGCDEELKSLTAQCPQVVMQNMHSFGGKLYPCCNSCFLSELGAVHSTKADFIDLNDTNISTEEKRAILSTFYLSPHASCRVCRWYDCNNANVRRHPAAEQI
ncbi:MAG: hypothetical protein LBD67_03795 [Candidatus Accumulibacter sp.]|jgi:hypothetical protein|nr:hypothetical protein [Accumulibacter sp.]